MIVPLSKSGVPQGTVGSTPTLSARKKPAFWQVFEYGEGRPNYFGRMWEENSGALFCEFANEQNRELVARPNFRKKI